MGKCFSTHVCFCVKPEEETSRITQQNEQSIEQQLAQFDAVFNRGDSVSFPREPSEIEG